jgi:hypothetical protein
MNSGLNMRGETAAKTGVFLALVGLCAVVRLIPHPPNFTPVASAALFAGFFFNRRLVACAVPLLAVLASDAVLGGYSRSVMLAVYAGHAFPVLLGMYFANRMTPLRIGGSAVVAAVVFFLGTNLAVWYNGILFERTAAGLVACYTAALPFFQHTLLGNLFWSATIFGAYGAANWLVSYLQERKLQPVTIRRG